MLQRSKWTAQVGLVLHSQVPSPLAGYVLPQGTVIQCVQHVVRSGLLSEFTVLILYCDMASLASLSVIMGSTQIG